MCIHSFPTTLFSCRDFHHAANTSARTHLILHLQSRTSKSPISPNPPNSSTTNLTTSSHDPKPYKYYSLTYGTSIDLTNDDCAHNAPPASPRPLPTYHLSAQYITLLCFITDNDETYTSAGEQEGICHSGIEDGDGEGGC
jgi:hypothetical protein